MTCVSEMFVKNQKKPLDLLVIPSLLPNKQEKHWHALIRARAIEQQSFVVAVSKQDHMEITDTLMDTLLCMILGVTS